MGTVIKVENLSKQYRLGDVGTGSLKDDFKRFRYKLMGKEDPFLQIGEINDRTQKSTSDYVWALQDINFEIYQGDVVGIIGRNGAGKSTLLKILSRTTAPTTGTVKVKGRIASLLEVGTGFHGELSGRENIYLNGAIMGLRKWEIDKKLDEITDFAGVEKYLDTPVKRYSSGMYVRLAFAVAAHLDPDILIVDEVLAVGDEDFQKKCLGKMKNVNETQGRTVLLVSHNLGIINNLCKSSYLFKNGSLECKGITQDVINWYIKSDTKKVESSVRNRFLEKSVNHFIDIYNCNSDLIEQNIYSIQDEIHLYVYFNAIQMLINLELAVSVYNDLKNRVFTIHEKLANYEFLENKIGIKITIPAKFLTPGKYSWIVCLNHPGIFAYDLHDDICGFTIVETGSEFSKYSGGYGNVFPTYKIKKIR